MKAGTRLGAFDILAPLGQGGMGEVYRARDTKLDRDVAIKVLPALFAGDPERLARFEREAKSVAQLSHPNILAIHDFARDGSTAYVVMELLEGETLRDRLAAGPLGHRRAAEYGVQIAHGLAAAHARGIVHRDLKPENLFVSRDDRVKILDFGLAKPVDLGTADMTGTVATAAGLVMGTVGYMAPEQVRAQAVDHRADLFALGAVLYEMVSGRRAFGGGSPADAISAILNSDPPDLDAFATGMPPALERIIRRCLEKKPELRFQSAGDLAFALETLSARTSGGMAAAPPDPRKTGRLPAWLPWAVAAAAALVAAGAWLAGTRQAGAGGVPELRLSLVPPAGHQFAKDAADFDPEFAISPDGSAAVFIAVDSRGVSTLWLRSLASVTPRQLPGTSGGRRPFWSADGRHIGFLTENGLTRVAVDGGAPQNIPTGSIAPALNANATWGADGRIIFEVAIWEDGKARKALYVVPDTGGTAEPVASAGEAPPLEQAQRFPHFLPDGRHYLYLSWTADPGERRIYLGSLENGMRTPIVQSGFRPDFIAPDVLLYVRERAVVAQRLSVARARLEGEPRVVVEGLALEAIPGGATFTASRAGVIAYRTRTRDLASELRWITRQGLVEPPLVVGSDLTVSLAADGRRAAMTRVLTTAPSEDRFPSNIWLFDLLRGLPTRFTVDPNSTDENPFWSPDGSEIAFASHAGGGLARVYVQAATRTGSARMVASGPHNFHPIHWARNGLLLLQGYATGGGSDDIDLWTVDPAASDPPRPFIVEPGIQAQGQFSPDGRWVAYTADDSGRFQVYVRSFPSGDVRVQISADGGAQPRWRGDGREVFYVTPNGTVMAVALSADGDLAPGAPIPLFSEPSLATQNNVFFYGGAAGYDVSPDGRRFLVSRLTVEPSASPIHLVLNALR